MRSASIAPSHLSKPSGTIVIGNILLKSVFAGAVLAFAAAQQAAAQPRKYDSEEVIKNTRTIDAVWIAGNKVK